MVTCKVLLTLIIMKPIKFFMTWHLGLIRVCFHEQPGFRLQNIWLSQICEVWFRSYLVGTGTSVSAPSMTACCSLTKATKGASRKSTSPTSTLEASASLGNFFINLFFSCTDRHGGNLTNPANAEKKITQSLGQRVCCCSTCQSKTLMVVDVFQGMATSAHLSKWGCCSASAFS